MYKDEENSSSSNSIEILLVNSELSSPPFSLEDMVEIVTDMFVNRLKDEFVDEVLV